MADSHVFHISFWVNYLLSVLIGFFVSLQDSLGLYSFPNPNSTFPCTENCGRWEGPFDSKIIGVAAANLPDGRILIWSSYARTAFSWPDLGDRGKTRTAIIDPVSRVVTEEEVRNTNHDMFCPGTAYLPDQKIMITGGTSSPRTTIYNIAKNEWIPGPDMNIGRGYHAMTLLRDGSVFTLGGSFTGGIGNKNGEVWHPDSNDWTVLPNVEADGTLLTPNAFFGVQTGDNHMWLYTAPNTDLIFHAGPAATAHWIDVNGNGRVIPSVVRGEKDQMVGCAVMYDIGKILVAGGSKDQDFAEAYSVSYVYDLNNGEQAAVERGGDLNIQRMFCNAIALPTGDVVVIGGQTKARKFTDIGGVKEPELWNPITKQFTVLAPMKNARTYHGTCILMKDARVACMGGGLCVDWRSPCPNDHLDFEIFTPPYLANEATRPTILSFSSSVMVGGVITVETNSPCSFAIVRLGAITHNINNDFRRIPLSIETENNNTYDLRVPSNTRVALPGLYWLFAINQDGIPSEGATVLVTYN